MGGTPKAPAPASCGVCGLLSARPQQERPPHETAETQRWPRRRSIIAGLAPDGISLIEFHRKQPLQMALHYSQKPYNEPPCFD